MTTLPVNAAVPAPMAHEHESEADIVLKKAEARQALGESIRKASECRKKGDAFGFQAHKKSATRHRAALDVYTQLHAGKAIANQK